MTRDSGQSWKLAGYTGLAAVLLLTGCSLPPRPSGSLAVDLSQGSEAPPAAAEVSPTHDQSIASDAVAVCIGTVSPRLSDGSFQFGPPELEYRKESGTYTIDTYRLPIGTSRSPSEWAACGLIAALRRDGRKAVLELDCDFAAAYPSQFSIESVNIYRSQAHAALRVVLLVRYTGVGGGCRFETVGYGQAPQGERVSASSTDIYARFSSLYGRAANEALADATSAAVNWVREWESKRRAGP